MKPKTAAAKLTVAQLFQLWDDAHPYADDDAELVLLVDSHDVGGKPNPRVCVTSVSGDEDYVTVFPAEVVWSEGEGQ